MAGQLFASKHVCSGILVWATFLLPFLFISSYPVLLSPPPFHRLFLCSALLLGGLTWLAQGAAKQNWKCLWVAWPPCASPPAQRSTKTYWKAQRQRRSDDPTADAHSRPSEALWLRQAADPAFLTPSPLSGQEGTAVVRPQAFGHLLGPLKNRNPSYEMLSG